MNHSHVYFNLKDSSLFTSLDDYRFVLTKNPMMKTYKVSLQLRPLTSDHDPICLFTRDFTSKTNLYDFLIAILPEYILDSFRVKQIFLKMMNFVEHGL
ncbi:hypothetical protein JOC86_000390 [Bacillus pakistanensis]|uniref:Uncharacterized protein n=1 Tax=Rossellomorea pakistanensis TaxID=992288 RepID=A0ABS2N7P1_9BACI|nr:hypothetical protein [Bacillus pakistanensis]MBM7583853.1 hypothetical protein [Bacillus pakistanensis]